MTRMPAKPTPTQRDRDSAGIALAHELERLGWDPFDPSPECARAMACPDLVSTLCHLDGDVVYWRWVYLVLLQRFTRRREHAGLRGELFVNVAFVFTLACRYTPRFWNVGAATELRARIARWHAKVLVAQAEACIRAKRERGWPYVRAHSSEFAVALVSAKVEDDLGFLGGLSDLPRFDAAMKAYGDGSEPHSIEDLAAWFDLLTRDGRSLQTITNDGRLVLSRRHVQTALESFHPTEAKNKRRRSTAPPVQIDDAMQLADRREETAECREQEAKLRSLLETFPDGVRALLDEALAAHDSIDDQSVLDGIEEAALESHPARRAAVLRRVTGGRMARNRLAAALGCTAEEIRWAERKTG